MDGDLLGELLATPWALLIMTAVVFADAFLVVVPGEIAVTALGATAATHGTPQLWLVIVCAATAAAAGDLTCYAIGRTIGVSRWRWMRARRVAAAIRWAESQLSERTALTLFTARFIPFARLAVNLTAGATRVSLPRYVALASFAAIGWALYQAGIGAIVASVIPGGTTVSIIVSVFFAVLVGAVIDAILRRRKRNAAKRESG